MKRQLWPFAVVCVLSMFVTLGTAWSQEAEETQEAEPAVAGAGVKADSSEEFMSLDGQTDLKEV